MVLSDFQLFSKWSQITHKWSKIIPEATPSIAYDNSNNDSNDNNPDMHGNDKMDGAGLLPKATLSTVTENVSENDHESPKQPVDGETNSLKPPDNSNIVI